MPHQAETNRDEALQDLLPPVLTPEEAAEYLRVTAEHIRCLIRSGELPAINVGTGRKRPLYRIDRSALREFIHRDKPAARPSPQAVRRPAVPDLFPELA